MAEGGGDAKGDLLWFVGFLGVIFILWLAAGGPNRPEAQGGPFLEPPAPLGGGETYGDEEISASRGLNSGDGGETSGRLDIQLGSGNARNEYVPGKEYITLANRGETAVNLAGWYVTNGNARRAKIDVAYLPTVTLLPGGEAVVTTGKPLQRSGWPFKESFRVNKCVGYLDEQFETSNITPSLPRDCPNPEDEFGASTLPDKCWEFVRSLSSCHEPEFTEDRDGNNLVDGREDDLTRQCRLYVEDHFSYDRCVAWHQNNSDFYTDEWRLYLNRQWEMWADNRETIALHDNFGKLVDSISY